MDELELELGNSQAGDDSTFREQIDVTAQPEGAYIGRLETSVKPATALQEAHEHEVLRLKDRVAELEREIAGLRANI